MHSRMRRARVDGWAVTQTVADGCERLRTHKQLLANTALPPDPHSETGTLAMHSGKIRNYGHLESEKPKMLATAQDAFVTDESPGHQYLLPGSLAAPLAMRQSSAGNLNKVCIV